MDIVDVKGINMRYKITGYVKDNIKTYNNYKVCKYTSEIIPHIDECIYLPHRGTYKIQEVLYNISDDRNEYDNNVMFVDLFLRPTTLY